MTAHKYRLTLTVDQLFAIVLLCIILGNIFTSAGIKVFEIYQASTGQFADFCFRLIAYWVRTLGG